MPHMQALLNTVVPVALVVLSGYLLGKRLEMDLSTLSRLTLYVLVPALILDSMYRAEYTREGLWGLTLGFALTYLLLFLLVRGRGGSSASPGKPPKPSSSAASSPTPATWASPWSTSPWGRRACGGPWSTSSSPAWSCSAWDPPSSGEGA
ncbi:putative permease [Thermus thermophilus]|nr:putative permease [Thermus thermophilus]